MWSVFLHLSLVAKKGPIELVNLSVLMSSVSHCMSQDSPSLLPGLQRMDWIILSSTSDMKQRHWSTQVTRQSMSHKPLLIMGICFPFLDNVCKYVLRNPSLCCSSSQTHLPVVPGEDKEVLFWVLQIHPLCSCFSTPSFFLPDMLVTVSISRTVTMTESWDFCPESESRRRLSVRKATLPFSA